MRALAAAALIHAHPVAEPTVRGSPPFCVGLVPNLSIKIVRRASEPESNVAGSATIHARRLPLAGSSLRPRNRPSLHCPSSSIYSTISRLPIASACSCAAFAGLSRAPSASVPPFVAVAGKHATRTIALTKHRTRCPAASQARRRRRDRSEARRVPPSRTAAHMPMRLILECEYPPRQGRAGSARRKGTHLTPRET